jgi:tyrosyl-tRNA synthetase
MNNGVMNLIEELKWRGLISNMVGGTADELLNGKVTFYVGTDPTGPSLHVGHLLAFIVARLLQSHGHTPIILVGGATASLGDPSFKAEERKLLSIEQINSNAENIKKQLSHIIDFDSDKENKAVMVNNYEWMKDFSFLDFAREIGKYITVNYMMAKESVKMRLEREGSGLSFTEYTYQLLQGYDFLHLYETYNCKMQIGGSDQWGNIMTGTELVRKKLQKDDTFALVWPLATRADGTKFGKSEGGKNVWLDPSMTTPFDFYQFWVNQTDEDAEKYIKMFTLLPVEDIKTLILKHRENPSQRKLQKVLAFEVTSMVHSMEDAEVAMASSDAMYDKNVNKETLKAIPCSNMVSMLQDTNVYKAHRSDIKNGIKLTELGVKLNIYKSKGELRKLISGGGISINTEKISDDITIDESTLVRNEYILLKQGKKVFKLITVEN